MNEASEMLNRLINLEFAGELRCDACARLVSSGPLNALLLLHSASHKADAQCLSDAVVVLDGAPVSGAADAPIFDPLGPGFPTGHPADRAVLDGCIAEDERVIEEYRSVLGRRDWPPEVRIVLEQCLASARARQRRLNEARALQPPVGAAGA